MYPLVLEAVGTVMGCLDCSPYRGLCGLCVRLFKVPKIDMPVQDSVNVYIWLQWLPVVVISAILSWSYYAYVVQLCVLTADSDVEKVLLLILYHFVLTGGPNSYNPHQEQRY